MVNKPSPRTDVATLPDSLPPLGARQSIFSYFRKPMVRLILGVLNALLRFRVEEPLLLIKTVGGYHLSIDEDALSELVSSVAWKGEYNAATVYAIGDIFIWGSNNSPGHASYKTILRDSKAGTFIVLTNNAAGTEPTEANITAGKFDRFSLFPIETATLKMTNGGTGYLKFNSQDGAILANSSILIDVQDANGHEVKLRKCLFTYTDGGGNCVLKEARVMMSNLWDNGDATETENMTPMGVAIP